MSALVLHGDGLGKGERLTGEVLGEVPAIGI